MKTFLKLLSLLKPFLKWTLLSILMSFVTISSSIGLLGTSAYLIARAALQPSIAVLQVSIVGVRFFGISRGIFRYLERLVSHSVNFRLLSRLRLQVYSVIEPLAPAVFQKYQSSDLLSRAIDDINILEDFYVRIISPAITAVLITLGMGIFVGIVNIQLAFILVAGLCASGIFIPLLSYRISKIAGKDLVIKQAQASINLFDFVHGLADLQVFGQTYLQKEKIDLSLRAYEKAQIHLSKNSAFTGALNLLLTNLTLWFILLAAIPMVRSAEIEGVFLSVITLLTISSFEAVSPLGFAAQKFPSSLAAGKRLFDLEDETPEVLPPEKPLPFQYPFDLSIQNLSFQFFHSSPEVLTDINFQINKGEKVALVGPSGSGKTTLSNLIFRFREYSTGSIQLNNIELRDLSLDELRRHCSLISQASYLFSSSIRKNLLLGNPSATQEELQLALEKVNLLQWVKNLPQGLDTLIGENGTQISGGERQRLLIARVLLRDSDLAIFDEATANLDPISSKNILQNVLINFQGKSLLWITHHFSGLENFDRIFVLRNGKIVEKGTHSLLLQQNGLYQNMWMLQNRQIISDFGTFSPSSTS